MIFACLANQDNVPSIIPRFQFCPSLPSIPPSLRDDNPETKGAGSRVWPGSDTLHPVIDKDQDRMTESSNASWGM